MQAHIQNVKTMFAVIVLGLFVFLGVGSLIFKDNPYTSLGHIRTHVLALKYKIELAGHTQNGVAASTLSLINEPSVYNSAKLSSVNSIPVLVYHGIVKNEKDKTADTDMLVGTFKDHLFALHNAGYTTITLDDLYRFMRGEKNLPGRSVLVTFDDGRTDSVYYADPLLRALNYRAIMFIIAGFSLDQESDYYLSEKQIRYISKGQWEIGSHTQDGHRSIPTSPNEEGHFLSHRMWLPNESRLETEEEYRERIRDDLWNSKNKLGAATGGKIKTIAFPFGDFGQGKTNHPQSREEILDITQSIYSLGFFQYAPGNRFTANYQLETNENRNFFMIRRITVEPDWSQEKLLRALATSEGKELPYADNFSENKGWIPSWGNIRIDPNDLNMKARIDQAGAAAILDGTRAWENYRVEALVNTPNQNNIFIWTRFQDDDNNAGCNFGPGFTHIEQTINGEKKVLKGRRGEDIVLPSEDFTVEARVSDRKMSCSINGDEIVATEFLDRKLDTGGIGFKTWDAAVGVGNLVIKELRVDPIQ